MFIQEITVCNSVKCKYDADIGSYKGEIQWFDDPVDLYLHFNPEDKVEALMVKLAFEAVYHEKELWTEKAVKFACDVFIPFFYHVAGEGAELVLTREELRRFLALSDIEINEDGELHMSFHPFAIGRRLSFLDIRGTIGGGFVELQDNGVTVPDLRENEELS